MFGNDVKTKILGRVAILHYAAPPIIGGVESTIYHHARLLVKAGIRVEVIAGRGEPFHPEVTFHRIPWIDSRHEEVLALNQSLAIGKVPRQFFQLRDRLIEELGKLLSQVDVCIVHNAMTLHKNLALTAALYHLSEQDNPHFIAWCHDFAWQDPIYQPELHAGYPWDLLRSPWSGVQYVVVSHYQRACLADLLGIPETSIQVIHPGVDPVEFFRLTPLTQRLIAQLDLLNAEPLILLPARLTRRKNVQFAMRVVAAIKPLKPRVVLVITGPPGPHNPKNIAYLESLRTLRDELNLQENVHFLYEYGESHQPLEVPDEVIADLYQLADALLFPSVKDGFGIPILEAGLARLPIFAADIPPIRESTASLAHLFDLQSEPESVAREMISFLENDPLSLMRQRVMRRYTWEAVVYHQVLPLLKGQHREDKT
jgi:glycosyltransferase involved in cell wall biosynthesis